MACRTRPPADLEVIGLHNHFFFDEPKVYFMHIGGQGEPEKLAMGVKAVWDAIKNVRRDLPRPASAFIGKAPTAVTMTAEPLARSPAPVPDVARGAGRAACAGISEVG